MIADIVPVLAAVTSVDAEEANAEFTEALAEAAMANGGVINTSTFAAAVLAFRAAHPFSLGDLQAGQKAKEEVDAREAGAP